MQKMKSFHLINSLHKHILHKHGKFATRLTSTFPKITTHYSVAKREDDNRWKGELYRNFHNFKGYKVARRMANVDDLSDVNMERYADEADVIIVGGGPAGLSCAIRIKQMCNEQGKDLRVCLFEKASEMGRLDWVGYCD